MSNKGMLRFTWQAKDACGKLHSGELQATSLLEAKYQILLQGLHIIVLRPVRKGWFSNRYRLKSAWITQWTRQLAQILSAGLALPQALEIVSREQKNAKMNALLQDIRKNILAGHSFAEALEGHRRHFDAIYRNLIHIGEQSATLPIICAELYRYRAKRESIRQKWLRMLFYPAAVLLFGCGIMLLLLLFIIPQFEQLFHHFHSTLPWITRAFLECSRWTQQYGIIFFIFLPIFLLISRKLYTKSPKIQSAFYLLCLKLPCFGKLMLYSQIIRLSTILSICLQRGIALVPALQYLKEGCPLFFALEMQEMLTELHWGNSIAKASHGKRLFPPLAQQMLMIGEETGDLANMLSKMADYYETEMDGMVDILGKLLEPAILLLVGLFVGSMVIAMYLPIFAFSSLF